MAKLFVLKMLENAIISTNFYIFEFFLKKNLDISRNSRNFALAFKE